MKWTSILAIYCLFWVLSAFLVMPFGVRTADETGDAIAAGHATSAPVNYNPRRIALRATILSAVLCGFYVLNYVYGWIDVSALDVTRWF